MVLRSDVWWGGWGVRWEFKGRSNLARRDFIRGGILYRLGKEEKR